MRAQEQKRFIDEFPVKNPVHFVEGVYDTKRFYDMARGMEAVPEGGERCFKCYRLRLEESAQYAREHGFDFFTTTLSISPLKNAEKLNEIRRNDLRHHDQQCRFCRSQSRHASDHRVRDQSADHPSCQYIPWRHIHKARYRRTACKKPHGQTGNKSRGLNPAGGYPYAGLLGNCCVKYALYTHKGS